MSDQKEKKRLAENLKRSKPLFKKEKAVIRSNFKKTLIATDIHGDYKALEFILEFAGQKKVDSIIFLGDYIDKGSEGVAVLNTLLELKIKYPKEIILLRGNHETHGLNFWFEFRDELINDPEIFDAANAVFEQLPIAVILNKSVFCVHGCIAGKKDESVKEISKDDAKKYIWNDPGTENGLLPSHRGGGIYRVGPDLIKKFLKQNKLQIIVRGHTSHPDGVRFLCDDKVVSLYSTLPYDDPDVKATVAVIKEKKMRFYTYQKNRNEFEWKNETQIIEL